MDSLALTSIMPRKLTEEERLARDREKAKLKKLRQQEAAERKQKRKELAEGKKKFRASKVWKDFRALMIKAADGRCALCGKKFQSRQLVLHHAYVAKDIPDYCDITKPERFRVLCRGCHTLSHDIGSKSAKNSPILAEIHKIIAPVLGEEWAFLRD